MLRLKQIYSSIIGKKIVAAVTGVILLGFLVGHVAGNLKVFVPHIENESGVVADIDIYAEHLQHLGEPMVPPTSVIWIARSVLLLALILHVLMVVQLSLINKAARPIGYQMHQTRAASLPAKFMMVTGLVILGFIIFHLLHLTVGALPFGDFHHGRVYANIHNSFLIFPVALMYVVVMAVIGVHLFHGIWSLFQTLGLDNPDRNKFLRIAATLLSVALFVGFSSIPLAFMLGLMPEPPAQELTLEPPRY